MESELSDLSANLFSTANEIVATERKARACVEESLVSTKATVSALERQLDAAKVDKSREENEKEAMRQAKIRTEYEMEELRKVLRGVNSSDVVSLGSGGVLRMMNSHLPFKNEYLGFVAHLRGLAGSSPDMPGITSLLTLPFLARLAVEDS
jgi:Rab guanine nucleotide exchange factor SEC2